MNLSPVRLFCSGNSPQEDISMTIDRFRHIHLALMVGISLFIPLLLGYSLYVDLSGTVLRSSDMIFEDSEDEDLLTCQNEFKVLVSPVSLNPLSLWTHSSRESNLISSPIIPITQNTAVLRC